VPNTIEPNDTEMAKVKIYHNPRCTKSRQTLALLQDQGIDPEIIEYLKSPPDEKTIAKFKSC
jgi:arsenate reductase